VSLDGRTGNTFKETMGNEGYSQLGIGALSHKGRYAMNGAIGEMIFVSSPLDIETRRKIEGYLAHKWGLVSSLPSYHPYKESVPEVAYQQTWHSNLKRSNGAIVQDDYSFGFQNCTEKSDASNNGRQFDCDFVVDRKEEDSNRDREPMLTVTERDGFSYLDMSSNTVQFDTLGLDHRYSSTVSSSLGGSEGMSLSYKSVFENVHYDIQSDTSISTIQTFADPDGAELRLGWRMSTGGRAGDTSRITSSQIDMKSPDGLRANYSASSLILSENDEQGGFHWTIISAGEMKTPKVISNQVEVRDKLLVTGQIVMNSDWKIEVPDYVFEEDYDLPSLSSVESYVKENKHLPEIPSAREIAEQGLNLGEMNLRLLKKIEELTLHMIEMEKKIERLENSRR
jgi:hypothetical protein